MKKLKYVEPELKVTLFFTGDIITTSGEDIIIPNTDENETPLVPKK